MLIRSFLKIHLFEKNLIYIDINEKRYVDFFIFIYNLLHKSFLYIVTSADVNCLHMNELQWIMINISCCILIFLYIYWWKLLFFMIFAENKFFFYKIFYLLQYVEWIKLYEISFNWNEQIYFNNWNDNRKQNKWIHKTMQENIWKSHKKQ